MRLLAVFVLSAVLMGTPAFAQKLMQIPPPDLTCSGDKVVWLNTHSRVYHYEGERYYGRTKQGKYMCEKAARAEGDRPTKNGQ